MDELTATLERFASRGVPRGGHVVLRNAHALIEHDQASPVDITTDPRRRASKLVVVVGALLVLLVAVIAWQFLSSDEDSSRVVTSSRAPEVSGAEAMRKVKSLTALISGIRRIEAKLVTAGEVLAAGSPGAVFGNIDFDQRVWAVAVSGRFQPSFGPGGPLPWAVFVVDSSTGTVEGSMGDDEGVWPRFFDALPGESVVGK